MVTVGVEGQRITKDSVVRTALLTAGATPQAIDIALAGAKKEPTWFEPVMTVSMARYEQLRPTIYPVPGTVFQTIDERTPLTPGLSDWSGRSGRSRPRSCSRSARRTRRRAWSARPAWRRLISASWLASPAPRSLRSTRPARRSAQPVAWSGR